MKHLPVAGFMSQHRKCLPVKGLTEQTIVLKTAKENISFAHSIHNLHYRAEGNEFITPFIKYFFSQRQGVIINIYIIQLLIFKMILNCVCNSFFIICFK